jgi:hypothetical protein
MESIGEVQWVRGVAQVTAAGLSSAPIRSAICLPPRATVLSGDRLSRPGCNAHSAGRDFMTLRLWCCVANGQLC